MWAEPEVIHSSEANGNWNVSLPVFLGNHFGAYGQAGISISWCLGITSPRQKPVHQVLLHTKILLPAPLLLPIRKV